MGITIVGLDCAKSSVQAVSVCDLPEDFKAFARRAKSSTFYATYDDLSKLAALGDIYVIEPTGAYHRVFVDFLTKVDKPCLFVSPRAVRHYAEQKRQINKSDLNDAAAVACYALENLSNPSAFLNITAEEIRNLHLTINSLNRVATTLKNQIWGRMAYEFPELCLVSNPKKPDGPKKSRKAEPRDWLEPNPSGIWLWLAGESCRYQKRYDRDYAKTIGSGVSELSRELARQVCTNERMQYALEQQLSELLIKPEFAPYHRVFDSWDMPYRVRVALLSAIYPIEKFLGEGGQIIRERKQATPESKQESTVRNRSLKAFQLSVGMGRILYESGQKTVWKMGGPSYARVAIWQFIKCKVVINTRKAAGEKLEELRSLYADLPTALNGDQRVMKISSRFVRKLFKDLVNEVITK